jgi:hypothetical protein
MRNTLLFSGFFAAIFSSSLTASAQRVYGDGSDTTETRQLPSFDKLHLGAPAEVILVKGDAPSVKIEGEKNIIAVLSTEVTGNELRIHFPFLRDVRMHQRLRIRVTTTALSGVSNSGSGSILSEDTFKSQTMYVHSSGSGRIELSLETDQLDCGISGSGNIRLKGATKEFEGSISGSGRLGGEELAIQDHTQIRISGSGNCTVVTNGVIDGHISGSGGIFYKGEPSSVSVTHSGSGRARKIS